MFHHQVRKLALAFVGAAAATALAVSPAAFAAPPAPDRATTVQIDDDPNSPDPPAHADIQVYFPDISTVKSGNKTTFYFVVRNQGPAQMKVFLDGKWCASNGTQKVCKDAGVVDYNVTLAKGQLKNVTLLCDPSSLGLGASYYCSSGRLHADPVGPDPNMNNNTAAIFPVAP